MNQKLTLPLEAGKFYKRRDGEKQRVDVVWPEHSGIVQPAESIVDGIRQSWSSCGRYYSDKETPWDLIADWTEPEPKWRAWRAEEVPVGAQLRSKAWVPEVRSLIMNCGTHTLVFMDQSCNDGPYGVHLKYAEAADSWLHSTDHGATWLPCGVLEEPKP